MNSSDAQTQTLSGERMAGKAQKKFTLLCVDDEAMILDLLEITFGSQYNVLLAHSAKDALEMMTEDVAVVICDQRMPKMSGWELLKIIREKYPDSVRVIITGYSDMNALIAAVNAGEIYRYVHKPWETKDITEVVKSSVERFKNNRKAKTAVMQNVELAQTNEDLKKELDKALVELRKAKSKLGKLGGSKKG